MSSLTAVEFFVNSACKDIICWKAFEALEPNVLARLREGDPALVSIWFNRATDSSIHELLAAMQSPDCVVQHLRFGFPRRPTKITDIGAGLIASALRSPEYGNWTYLKIGTDGMTSDGVRSITSALESPHCSLTGLFLLGKCSAGAITAALESPVCNVTGLRIHINEPTKDALPFPVIASAMETPHCKLDNLEVSGSGIVDADTQAIALVTKSPHCKLINLVVDGLNLTDASAQAIASTGRLWVEYLGLPDASKKEGRLKIISSKSIWPLSKWETGKIGKR